MGLRTQTYHFFERLVLHGYRFCLRKTSRDKKMRAELEERLWEVFCQAQRGKEEVFEPHIFLEKTKKIFAEFSLNYDAAVLKLERTLATHAPLAHVLGERKTNMFSEHWTAAAAISATKIHRILELGTFDGEFAHFLSLLFPDAEIITMDLPDDSPIFVSSYGRGNPERLAKFLSRRKAMLDRPNIRFVQADSFLLPELGLGTFDLVWVDACHEYPEAAWDVCNAWHACNTGGWLLFDDIYLSDTPPRGNSTATRDAALALNRHGLNEVRFFIKRFAVDFSKDPNVRKHVGITRKGAPSARQSEFPPSK